MQTVTTYTRRHSYTIPGASEPCLREQKNQGLVALLIKILGLFQEIADCLVTDEQEKRHRATFRYLHANCLLLSERIKIFYETGSSSFLSPFAGLMLNQFSSLLRTSDGSASVEQQTQFFELAELYKHWNTLTVKEEKVSHITDALRLDATNCWDALVASLEEWVGSLEDPSTSTTEESYTRRKRIREPPCEVYVAARSMVHALANSSTCFCDPCHGYTARLKLATHRQPPETEEKYTFELLLSSNQAVWQETAIHSLPPKKKSKVRIAVEERRAGKRGHSRRIPVQRLCEHLKSRQILCCLNLEIEEGRLWKFRSSDSRLRIGNSYISLEKIIEGHPTTLSEKVKRVLAVLVGHCFLHLHETAWVKPCYFNASRILFFGTHTSLPLVPFIDVEIDHSALPLESVGNFDESDEFIDPDDLPLHSHPSLVMLAILLMELYMAKPVSCLVESTGFAYSLIQEIDENSRYRIATEAFRKFGPEFTDNYRLAVATCLDPNVGFDNDDNEIEGDDFKSIVYKEIVQLLEEELDQGFGKSIPVDYLDQAAPALNLNRWGTINLAAQPEAGFRGVKDYSRTESVSASATSSPGPINEDSQAEEYVVHNKVKMAGYNLDNSITPLSLTHGDYTVGWISALAEEMAAARAMLDQEHPSLPQDFKTDNNNYILGRIGSHNVVLACLPSGVSGTTSAAIVANRMRSTFQNLRFGLMVGIGGAAPSEMDDIRLGDVVVGVPHGRWSGVVQYDFGKTIEEGKLRITSALNRAPDILLTAVSKLTSQHFLLGHKIELYLQKMIEQYPRLKTDFSHPGAKNDVLYQTNYSHASKSRECSSCDGTRTVLRKARHSNEPVIHYGLIASGNQVMKDAVTRDRLKQDLDILCFEMEAAGLVDDFPCLVIRGISDYADSHKNDQWRYYAAATAAAYAKELLNTIR
ncbi:hypothetical protein BJY01DRAFT_248401 [Aspergillus pseudoustus]|uniref:Nucleoside phosphorylase domain-containing protein n=1 Tax=Aspergillus pseudoustus TaxID=1810923 RepID=A0ABR4JV54_9EURO